VFLIRVVEGTPAAVAGLEVGDRIDELDGRPFADAAAFQREIHSLLDSARPEVHMLVERHGHMRAVSVKMPSSKIVSRP
jgi:S1-C subfamily serine protease